MALARNHIFGELLGVAKTPAQKLNNAYKYDSVCWLVVFNAAGGYLILLVRYE